MLRASQLTRKRMHGANTQSHPPRQLWRSIHVLQARPSTRVLVPRRHARRDPEILRGTILQRKEGTEEQELHNMLRGGKHQNAQIPYADGTKLRNLLDTSKLSKQKLHQRVQPPAKRADLRIHRHLTAATGGPAMLQRSTKRADLQTQCEVKPNAR